MPSLHSQTIFRQVIQLRIPVKNPSRIHQKDSPNKSIKQIHQKIHTDTIKHPSNTKASSRDADLPGSSDGVATLTSSSRSLVKRCWTARAPSACADHVAVPGARWGLAGIGLISSDYRMALTKPTQRYPLDPWLEKKKQLRTLKFRQQMVGCICNVKCNQSGCFVMFLLPPLKQPPLGTVFFQCFKGHHAGTPGSLPAREGRLMSEHQASQREASVSDGFGFGPCLCTLENETLTRARGVRSAFSSTICNIHNYS